jgi:hypothetical protein
MPEIMKERPAYVRFEKRVVEDRDASLKAGRFVGRDVVYALITPPGSKDIIPREVESTKDSTGRIINQGWLDYLETQVTEGRLPDQFLESYRRAYEKWKKGEEVPVNGTPIKTWPVLSPAQITNLIAMNIHTVEDLAALNEEGKARFGMGIIELQRKAINWLEAANSLGGVAARITALEVEHAALKEQNDRQRAMIEKLQAENKALKREPAPA